MLTIIYYISSITNTISSIYLFQERWQGKLLRRSTISIATSLQEEKVNTHKNTTHVHCTYINHFPFKYNNHHTSKPSTTKQAHQVNLQAQQTHQAQQVNSQSKTILFQPHQAQQVKTYNLNYLGKEKNKNSSQRKG